MISSKIFGIVYFTDKGKSLARIIKKQVSQVVFEEKPEDMNIQEFVFYCFNIHMPIIFIGSTGIAVRYISPFAKDKLTDSAVIVIDELGQFVIPLLSGHVGGANEFAELIALNINATAVITTATDINHVFSVDVFARANGLRIVDKSKIKKVSSKLLKGENIVIAKGIEEISLEGNTPAKIEISKDINNCDVLITNQQDLDFKGLMLVPKTIILGMGCKKDKSFEELLEFVSSNYDIEKLKENLCCICTIDVKAKEKGLLKLASFLGVPLICYSAKELDEVTGCFSESDFVKSTVGVGNVSERAAVAFGGKLCKNKIALNGMTLAEANRDIRRFKWQGIFS